MKTSSRLAFSLALLSLATVGAVRAADTTESAWSGGTNVWGTAGNWGNGLPSATVSAEFNSAFTNQPSQSATTTAQGLWLAEGLAQAVTINSSNTLSYGLTLTGTATLDGNANTAILIDDSANYGLTIGPINSLTVGNSTSFLVNNASTLSIASAFTIAAGQTLTLGGTNAAGVASITGVIAATTGALAVNTAGTVVLGGSAVNSFTGGTTLTAGTLALNKNGALGTNASAFTINGGILDNTSGAAVVFTTTNAQTWNSNVTFAGSNALTFIGAVALNTGAVTVANTGGALLTESGAISGTSNLTFAIGGSGGITVGAVTNAGTITNAGTGTGTTTVGGVIGAAVTGIVENSATSTLALNGANTAYAGGLAIKVGTVIIKTSGAGTGTIVLGDTGGGSAATLLGNSLSSTTIANAITLGTTTGPLTIGQAGGGTTASTTITGTITGMNNLILSNQTTGTGSIAFATAGTLNNTGTVTNAGTNTSTVDFATGNIGGMVQIGAGVIGANVTGIIQNSATSSLYFNGANSGYIGPVTIKNGTLYVGWTTDPVGKGTITLGDASGSDSATLAGIGTATLNNAIVLGGTTGVLTIGSINSSTNHSLTLNGAINMNGNNLTFMNSTASTGAGVNPELQVAGAISGAGNITVATNAITNTAISGGVNNTGTITNSGTGTGTTTISGTIGANTTTVTQNSATSALVLSRTNGNLYTDGTNVALGSLLITNTSGSGTGNGAVTVGNGGIFGGSGIVAATSTAASVVMVGSGGAISPGGVAAAVGTLTFNGLNASNAVLTLAAGAQLNFDLAASNASDKIVFLNYVAGDLSLAGNTFNFTGAQAGTYTLFQFYSNGGSTLVNSGLLGPSFDLADSTGLAGYTATLDFGTTGDINLVLTAVPEPSTWLLFGSGCGAVLVFAARRRLVIS